MKNACYALGALAGKDDNRSFKFLKKACEMGQKEACYQVGIQQRAKNNTKVSNIYLKKACDIFHREACYIIGRDAYTKNDYTKATNFLDTACKLLHGHACFFLGNINRSQSHRDLASLYYKKACKLGIAGTCCPKIIKAAITSKKDLEDLGHKDDVDYLKLLCDIKF